jgi:hypothetical protein
MKNGRGPYMQKAGKGPRMETGAGIPKELMSGPAMHEAGHEGTDPKGETTVTRERATEGGQTGWRTTATTVTPGSGGDSLSGEIIRTPEGDAAYAALDQAGRDAQDAKFKALNPRVPGSTNISSRFLADPMKPLTKPVIPGKANIKAEGIKPMASNRLVTFQAQRGTADDPNNTQRGVSGTNAGRGSMTMDSQVMTVEKANEKKSALDKRNKRIEDKYANNPNQEKAQARVNALKNKAVINKYK